MKRMYIGIALLAIILVLGIWLTLTFQRMHHPLSQLLEQAGQAAQAGDWQQAIRLAQEAANDWEKYRDFTAAVADHEPLEQMDAMFARLRMLQTLEDREEFAVTCTELSRLAAALTESQEVHWFSLL